MNEYKASTRGLNVRKCCHDLTLVQFEVPLLRLHIVARLAMLGASGAHTPKTQFWPT